MLDVKEALKELSEKSYKEIQIETAYKWGSRAAASYEKLLLATSKSEKLMLWTLGAEYYAEALEHASLIGDKAETLLKLEEELDSYLKKASKDIEDNVLGDSK